MASINLPSVGQRGWGLPLNAAITAINSELNGRLSPSSLTEVIDFRVQDVAADIIASDPTVVQAAVEAMEEFSLAEGTHDTIMTAVLGNPSGTSSTLLATAHAERYAALMGVEAGTGADQTAALQDAINAAGALKVALVLPAGVIRVDGQITLPRDWVSIRGSHMSILDWSNATFSGPAIRGTVGAGGIIPVPAYGVGSSRIENVSLRGPQATDTEVDGLSLETPSTYTGRFVLDRVNFVGFRHQEIIGSGSYLHKHFSCTYARAQQTAVYFAGTSDSGENVSWSGCIFHNMNSSHPAATFLRGVQESAGEAYFSHCSFDYGRRTLVADSGTWDFSQCHIESDFNAAPWFSISSPTGATRPTVLAFHGGQIMPHDTVDGSPSVAGAHFLAIGVDEPARGVASVIPVRVVLEGVEFQPKIRNCTLLRNFGTRAPLVTGSPVPFPFTLLGISSIKDSLFTREGPLDDVIATAANLPAQPLDYQAGRGWQTSAWVKTNFGLSLDESSDSGGRSLKIAPTANVSQWVVSQCAPCRSGGVVHVAMSYRIPGVWSGQLAPRIRFWDAAGVQISETTWYAINNSTMDTDPSYRIIADQRSVPNGAAYVTVALWAAVTGGEVAYIDALELMPL
ncbi:hypothetical protein [Microbacterium sp. No. 7]|uniref:hypothetical protein n=1 Tax=Microbacterium sp. No. 7 TaxID=1714373 RepID=UPI0006ED2326|nr:hypothetical protein [Microbacterium sp. No. 7]ALJ19495.1 hypothetical protein AOA12_06075 [Microbacterium sp. No. 7]